MLKEYSAILTTSFSDMNHKIKAIYKNSLLQKFQAISI